MSDSGQGYNIFGLATGVLSTLAFLPVVFIWFLSILPKARLGELETLLSETEGQFHAALQEGLLSDEESTRALHAAFWKVKVRVDGARAQVYRISNFGENARGWKSGLSDKINVLCKQLQEIRADISKRSSRERQMRGAEGFETSLKLLSQRRENMLVPVVARTLLGSQQPTPGPTVCTTPDNTRSPSFNEPRLAEIGDDHTRCKPPLNGDLKNPRGFIFGRRSLKARMEKRRERRQLLMRLGRKLFGGSGSGSAQTSPSYCLGRLGFLRRFFLCASSSCHEDAISDDKALSDSTQREEEDDPEWRHTTYWEEVELLA